MRRHLDLSARKMERVWDKTERHHLDDKNCRLPDSAKAFHQVPLQKKFLGEIIGNQVSNIPIRLVNVGSSLLTRSEMRGLQLKQKSHIRRKTCDMEIINQRLDAINEMYSLRQPEIARSFLASNTLLLSNVSNTYQKIRQQFPSENIFLEVYSSPTYPDEREVLISVSTSISPKEAIERLDKVDSERWPDNSDEPYVNICLKLEYQ
jgi:hypothetical protein